MTNFSCQHELLLAPSGTQLLYVESRETLTIDLISLMMVSS